MEFQLLQTIPVTLDYSSEFAPIVEDAIHLSYRTWGNQTAADVEASGLWTTFINWVVHATRGERNH